MRVSFLSRARFRAVLLAACLAANPAAARAQTSGVTGTVVDAQGLALPGVLIEIRTDDGDRAGSGVTDRAGAFELADVEPGAYRLTADLFGFEAYEATIDVGPDGAEVAATLAIRQFAQELTVTGMMPDVATEQVVPARRIEQRVAQDLALSLREQTGVTAVRRGAVNLDPAVRGLYAEQIGVFVDGTRTFAAGPARMDSGLSHVSPHALQSVRVVRGPYALTWGAGALSAIRADTFRPAFADGGFRINGRAGYNYGSNGGANDGYAGLWGSNGGLRFTFQHNTRTGGDYNDGNRDGRARRLRVARNPLEPRRPAEREDRSSSTAAATRSRTTSTTRGASSTPPGSTPGRTRSTSCTPRRRGRSARLPRRRTGTPRTTG